MSDMADLALMLGEDLDEAHCQGEIDEETNEIVKSPYMYERKAHGPGPCPVCKSATILKIGKYGEFYGCPNFPKCKGRRGA